MIYVIRMMQVHYTGQGFSHWAIWSRRKYNLECMCAKILRAYFTYLGAKYSRTNLSKGKVRLGRQSEIGLDHWMQSLVYLEPIWVSLKFYTVWRVESKLDCQAFNASWTLRRFMTMWIGISYLIGRCGFVERWCMWFKHCVTTVCFSILVNGTLVGFFSSSHVVRSRGSFSPFLFVITMDTIS